ARQAGVELIEGRVDWVETTGGRVSSVQVSTSGAVVSIDTPRFVNAAGPMLHRVGALMGLELPVFSELHLKTWMEDHLGVVPRDAPFMIWEDPQNLDWSDEEREFVAELPDGELLLGEMPPGVHTRIEGGGESNHLLILWPYHLDPVAENFPLPIPEHYAEICVRGISAMIPGLASYADRMPRPFIDGGYYTKCADNRPLAGPLPIEGAFIHGALSGYGLMASMATSEIVAAHIAGAELPGHAAAFHPARWENEGYREQVAGWEDSTQL
ncbi:MAG: FAD-dependent oxidoreductase, partial [Holophagae bacterium]